MGSTVAEPLVSTAPEILEDCGAAREMLQAWADNFGDISDEVGPCLLRDTRRWLAVAAGAGDPTLPRMPNETLRELLHEGIEEVYHWEDHVLAKQLALWLEARGVVIQRPPS